MKEDFLRPPRTTAEWCADALRAVGVLGVLAAALWLTWTDAGIAALATPAMMLPRMLGLRAWFDLTTCVVVLVAAWSNVFDLYTTVGSWDLVMHFAGTGVLAVIAAVLLGRTGVVGIDGAGVRARVPMVLVPLIALALSAVWEIIEWIGVEYVSDQVHVGYRDTIGDMIFGGLGGVAAGALMVRAAVERPAHRDVPEEDAASATG